MTPMKALSLIDVRAGSGCPFITAVESGRLTDAERMAQPVERAVLDQLLLWARCIVEGLPLDPDLERAVEAFHPGAGVGESVTSGRGNVGVGQGES